LDPGNYVISAYFRLITGFFPNDTLPQFKQQRNGRVPLNHQPYWWRGPAFRKMKCLMRWNVLIKVIQNLLNDRRVLNACESLPRERSECFGYYLDGATTFTAGFTKSRRF